MKRFERILCYVGTDDSETAISHAVSLALVHDAKLTVMNVVKPIPKAIGLMTDVAPAKELQDLVVKDHERQLLDRMAEYSDTSVAMELVVTTGDPATEIVHQVIEDKIDLVVKTADGFSPAGRMFGSVARALLRMCPCPVWLLKPAIHGKFDRVLAAIDLEAHDKTHQKLNRDILEFAYSIARENDADLHIVSAWGLWMEGPLRRGAGDKAVDHMIGMQESKIHAALDHLLQAPMSGDESIHIHLKRGDSAEVIRQVSDEVQADLMVMGTVCRTGVPGFLIGNTAESILPELTCSLLALKPEGFVSPIEMAEGFLGGIDESSVPLI